MRKPDDIAFSEGLAYDLKQLADQGVPFEQRVQTMRKRVASFEAAIRYYEYDKPASRPWRTKFQRLKVDVEMTE
jgi:hypothetical protein